MAFLCHISRFVVLSSGLLMVQGYAAGQASRLQVDASSFMQPEPTSFHGGSSISPSGHSIGMNSRYLVLDGKPWLPVMGEFHYSRVPKAEWEQEILKMKSAGISIIATYVIWNHHEEIEGQFDWTGSRNLREFAELCQKHGMYLYVRIGPWAHGEARNGGFPDWLLKKTQHTRENDPVYLSYVKPYYAQIAKQLKDLLWKDGGPVIGIQLENEYAKTGVGAGIDHILELKRIAMATGLDVPLYSVTGWDNAVIPKGKAVAVFGGYPDAPWGDSLKKLPPQEVYVFRFGSRVTGNMGAIGAVHGTTSTTETYDFPFMTAEMGGGIQVTYHRRPLIAPDDIAAMVPVMLGSGVNLYGSYMFQGGENPDGKLTTLQESQATGYPTDVPVKSYDFQAPLSEFGQERPVLRKLKVFDYFMQDFGASLAPMMTYAPDALPTSPADLKIARVSVRTNGSSGFLFFNNYVRQYKMPDHPGFQVVVKLENETVSVPQKPITLPSGVYGIWPINMKVGDATLRYATAQPFAKQINGGTSTIYFVETPGVRPEFVFAPSTEITPNHAVGTKVTKRSLQVVVDEISPSLIPAFSLRSSTGALTKVVLLSQQEAENSWKIASNGVQGLLVSSADFYADSSIVTLETAGDPNFKFQIVPGDQFEVHGDNTVTTSLEGAVRTYAVLQAVCHPKLSIHKVAEAGVAPQVKLGPKLPWRAVGVAAAPEDSAFDTAAKWNLTISPKAWQANDLFLDIHYDGDVARLTSGGKLLVDNFYTGTPWIVGLKRFRQQIETHGLQLEILPRRKDAPIYIDAESAVTQDKDSGQILRLSRIDLLPEYEASFKLLAAQ